MFAFSSLFVNVLLVATTVAVSVTPQSTPDHSWDPIDPHTFPPTLPTDNVQVEFVYAPLLEAEIGPVFKYFHIYHGGMAFRNHRTNFTFTVNYDSVDLNLFQSQLPTLQKQSNGSIHLQWHSAGSAYCYKGVHPHYWTEQVLGTVNGTVFNNFMTTYLMPFNGTWPYYEMFNVKHHHSHTAYLTSRECFDFVIGGIAALNVLGANLHGSLKRNEVVLFSKAAPVLVDATQPAVHKKIVSFYEVLTLHWGHLDNLFDLIKLLIKVADGSEFYLHVGDQYYSFQLEWPILDVSYVSIKF
eukprot:TRINITY_DN4559_c0_g1_i1.p1 TRINITY_DN4559_c0_g1~~TRINITY_DN4559_c0_g1_i1.p1  ORF type:complete len:297 (+),score=96.64 TRINITY_DN4559_c0_g1_i1:65-955(+)